MNQQRGQAAPVFVGAIVATLAMAIFLANYTNLIRYQVRALNAADVAASAGISTVTNVRNYQVALLYAASVEEFRLRELEQAILNMYHSGYTDLNGRPVMFDGNGNRMPLWGVCGGSYDTCNAAYVQLRNEYVNEAWNYGQIAQMLHNVENVTAPLAMPDAPAAMQIVSGGQSSACDSTLFDCGMTYNSYVEDQYYDLVDVETCMNVPNILPQFMTAFMKVNTTASQVVGRSVKGIVPVEDQQFTPGKTINPITGQYFQPLEPAPGLDPAQYPDVAVDFTNLTVSERWFRDAESELGKVIGPVTHGNDLTQAGKFPGATMPGATISGATTGSCES